MANEEWLRVVIDVETKKLAQTRNQIKKLGFDVEELGLKKAATLSSAWKTRYASMILDVKKLRLELKKSADASKGFMDRRTTELKKLTDEREKLNELGKRMARVNKNVNKVMSGGAQGLIDNATRVNKLGGEYDSLLGSLKMPIDKFKQFNKEGGRFDTVGGRMGNKLRKMTHGLKGFRMELLGVMFFGMGVTKWMTGLLKPALQATGLFELWATVLQVLFLPTALWLLDVLMPIFQWIFDLSDKTKLLIGKFVIFTAILGVAAFLFGMLGLGVGSLILVLNGFFDLIEKIIPDVSILGVNLSSFIEVGLGIAIVSKAWNFFKNTVSSLLDKFFELDMVKELLKTLGIEVDDNESGWQKLKTVVSTFIKNFDDKFDISKKLEDAGIDVDDIKLKVDGWLQTFKEGIKDLGLKGFTLQIDEILLAVDDLTPSIKKMASALETIAAALKKIKEFWDRLKTAWGMISDTTGTNDLLAVANRSNKKNAIPYSLRDPLDSKVGPGGVIGPTIQQTNNINVSNMEEVERMIEDNNKKLVDDVKRVSPITVGG